MEHNFDLENGLNSMTLTGQHPILTMERSFDLENSLNSMTLTGQHQPTLTLNLPDSCLNNQILDDVILGSYDAPLTPTSTIDDINALIDNQYNSSEIISSINNRSPSFSNEHDEITKLISTPIGEMPRFNTIEDTMERMNLSSSTTDNLLSAICIEMGSSPVEQKEIEHKRSARDFHQIYQRTERNSKQRKSFGLNTSSSTVGPIDILPSRSSCQPCTTIETENDFYDHEERFCFDSFDSKKIRIASQPRRKFYPRTENESKHSPYYIQCDSFSQFEYPSIEIPFTWKHQSVKNIIEVTLVRCNKEPHLYKIDNKSCSSSYNNDALIFRHYDPQTLYFCVTNDDFNNGYKSFMMECIKNQRDETISEKSMLRFARLYQDEKNQFRLDESSVTYSAMMEEVYGDIGVEHMGPQSGSLNGNERVYCLLKGRILKDDLTVFLTKRENGWRQQMPFTKSGNTIYFSMPQYPFPPRNQDIVKIIINYKGEELFQSTYLYKGSLDHDLAALNLNRSTPSHNNPSTANGYDMINYLSGTGVCPVTLPTNASKRVKRLDKK